MIKAFKRISDWLDMVSVRVAAGMVAVILALTILGAISRYIFRSPISWPLAVDQILMIWAALLGIPAALKRGEHMGVEALFKALPGKAEVILRYFDYIMIFVFTAILFWYGWLQFKSTGDTYMLTQNVEISSKWLVAAIPVGAFIQLVHLLTIPYLIEAEKEKYAAYLEQ